MFKKPAFKSAGTVPKGYWLLICKPEFCQKPQQQKKKRRWRQNQPSTHYFWIYFSKKSSVNNVNRIIYCLLYPFLFKKHVRTSLPHISDIYTVGLRILYILLSVILSRLLCALAWEEINSANYTEVMCLLPSAGYCTVFASCFNNFTAARLLRKLCNDIF